MRFYGNPEHLKILMEAINKNKISLWNDFNDYLLEEREKADLSGIDLTGIHLLGINLKAVILDNSTFEKIHLENANLENASLIEVNLKNAILKKVNLENSILEYSNLQYARLREVNLKNANLEGVTLNRSFLTETNLKEAYLNGVNLKEAKLIGINLIGANLFEANLMKSELSVITFYKTILFSTNFRETKLFDIKYKKKYQIKNIKSYKGKFGIPKQFDLQCLGICTDGMHGDPIFKRFLEDQDYIENFKGDHKYIAKLWRWTSDYGRSIKRWIGLSIGLILLFTILFTPCPDWGPNWAPWKLWSNTIGASFEQTSKSFENEQIGFFDALYFSVVTFTTLGFGDIVASNLPARIMVMVEVILGYIMLGGLISILATKIARRS